MARSKRMDGGGLLVDLYVGNGRKLVDCLFIGQFIRLLCCMFCKVVVRFVI